MGGVLLGQVLVVAWLLFGCNLSEFNCRHALHKGWKRSLVVIGITWFVELVTVVIAWAWSVIGLSFSSRRGINYAYQNGVVELECLAKNSNIRVRNRV